MTKRILLTLAFALVGVLVGAVYAPGPLTFALAVLAGVGVGLFVPTGGVNDRFGVADYVWRLVPANPILLRVVESGGKRRRDLFIRCGYLALLIFIVLYAIGTGGGSGELSALNKTSFSIFRSLSYLQLALVALLAPVFTAGSITQEKDSQTYDILLSTPLTNGQIVLGSLLSRLFFVVALLVSGIPIFSITQIFGGVAIGWIARSFGIAAATAFVTGAMAMAIATFKVGTRRTIFSFYFFIVLYLVGLFLLDTLPYFRPALADGSLAQTSWFTPIHPFLALRTVFNDRAYAAPDFAALPPELQAWPLGWALSSPASFYTALMFFLSLVLVLPSIALLRRMAQSNVSFQGWLLTALRISKGDKNRRPRPVWSNPIAWREAKTKASAARSALLRYGFIVAGLAGAAFLLYRMATPVPVAQYTMPDSWDPSANKFTVYSDAGARQYDVRGTPLVTLDGREASLDALRGKYDVTVAASGTRVDGVTAKTIEGAFPVADVRQFLLGAAIVEFAMILLIVTNAAASTVTREKEDGSLDLLLSTPITSHYYVWGKLRGLVSFVLPLVAVPVASVLLFVFYDLYRALVGSATRATPWVVFPEAIVLIPAMLVIVCAFAAILGMHMSLRCRTTVMAVMSSVAIVAGACGVLGFCGYGLTDRGGGGEVGVALASFSPFTLLSLLIDPYHYGGRAFDYGTGGIATSDDVATARTFMFVGALLAVAAYTGIVWAMYKSMVKNFDMTIRRQSR
ncbi:MAG TPA: ABC transporter permease subunit [Tepidisphaeraceae bacterium]|nr:ABC transporter permease subunit [Tepidisphaeraceae bacterium]